LPLETESISDSSNSALKERKKNQEKYIDLGSVDIFRRCDKTGKSWWFA